MPFRASDDNALTSLPAFDAQRQLVGETHPPPPPPLLPMSRYNAAYQSPCLMRKRRKGGGGGGRCSLKDVAPALSQGQKNSGEEDVALTRSQHSQQASRSLRLSAQHQIWQVSQHDVKLLAHVCDEPIRPLRAHGHQSRAPLHIPKEDLSTGYCNVMHKISLSTQ